MKYMTDRDALGEFLRTRREALAPEDVGLPRGRRRRTAGLRREEVAVLCHMSADYYSRLERAQGPQPSEQMTASIALGLHLTRAERDHLFWLAGHQPPPRGSSTDHISPGMLRIFDRLADTPAEIVGELGETLRQTPLSAALVGDLSGRTGLSRSAAYRWFTEPVSRELYPPDDHDFYSRMYVSNLRGVVAVRGPESRAAQVSDELRARYEEFRRLWERHEIGVAPHEVKRLLHPEVGLLELNCQILHDPVQTHSLLVYTASPGSESYDKLALLAVIGRHDRVPQAASPSPGTG